ncbi:MAG: single-stranded DNA-binding protein [Mycoplasmataceae bacterium RV_VA103A]|nr:MAG: single-stranded DNA-binding protein [Mycoplasmataceae bacterium RV_VA103A]
MSAKLSKEKDQKTSNNLNLYQKLHLIQSQIKELIRTEENKFQKYKFFNELQVLNLLKPLLEKYHLTILLSDDETKEFSCEQVGNMYLVKYGKKCLIINGEQPEEQLVFYFWAPGLNQDPSKAKGSAETYATKYFLSKLFLMPVKDEGDPDYSPREEKREEATRLPPRQTITSQQVESLINLFRSKTADNKERQTKFLEELDKLLEKRGVKEKTTSGNFRERLSGLLPVDYQWLYNWLLDLK